MITEDSKNILVVDDSEFFRVKLFDILTEAGHKVRVLAGGIELTNELQTNPNGIDMILLDLQMPQMDGFMALEWIRDNKLQGKFHVLAITGVYETTQVIDKLKNLGATGLITKAFTPEEIVYRVNKILFPQNTPVPRSPRVPISHPVDFTIDEIASTGYLLNISETGMFLHTKKTIFPGTIMQLNFTLPGSIRQINVKGIIKWCTQMSGKNNIFSGAGVEFINAEQENLEIIKEFVECELKKFGL